MTAGRLIGRSFKVVLVGRRVGTTGQVGCHCLLLAVTLDVSRPRHEEASGWTFAAPTKGLFVGQA